MSDHYYTPNPASNSHPETFVASILGESLTLQSDAGVFSRGQVDYGTQTLIRAVHTDCQVEGPILDVGCGYGPIGLALARLNPARLIYMLDINERAVNLAIDNAKRNNITNVRVDQSNLFDKIEEAHFSAIVSNPPIRAGKKVVHEILKQSKAYMVVGGKIYIVIQKKQGAPSAKKALYEVYGNVTRLELDRGYWVLMSEKIS